MTNKEKWNLIVDRHARLFGELESKVQTEWELYCSDLFDYKRLLNEIDSQRHLTVGSGNAIIPDIILRIDGKDAFDIELKQYSLAFDPAFETQLISYLNQTHLAVGMIVCNKIYLYHYEYATIQISRIEIPFARDNPDGIALMDLLMKGSFSADKIKEYIEQKNTRDDRIKTIREIVSKEWLEAIVKAELRKEYSDEEIETAIGKYKFSVSAQQMQPTPVTPAYHPVKALAQTPYYSITPMLRKWCTNMASEGKIGYEPGFSTEKYVRFTTSEVDALIPYQPGYRSGWKNGHFYAYEIVNDAPNCNFYLWFVLTNKNAPEELRKVFPPFFVAAGKYPKSETWEWWASFKANKFHYTEQTTEEEVFAALDRMFEEVSSRIGGII